MRSELVKISLASTRRCFFSSFGNMIPELKSYSLPSTSEEIPNNKVDWKLDPARAVLLIHDMQEYFLHYWDEDSETVKKLVQNVKLLRALCKSQGIPVFYTAQPINQKPEDRALLNDMWGPGIDKRPELRNIISELTPDENDRQLVKWRYSAFARSTFEADLKELKRDQLIICGVYAHIGCLTTATEAFMKDIQPFMVADALADFSRSKHDIALQIAAECSGRVELLNDLVTSLVDLDIRKVIADALEEGDDWPEDDDNLVDYGLDSVKIMAMAGRWRQVFPQLDFVKLAENPTIESWRKLLTE